MKLMHSLSSGLLVVRNIAIVFTLVFAISSQATTSSSTYEDFLKKIKDSAKDVTVPTDLFLLWKDISDRAGFEIGNGKKLIKNLAGKYLFKMYDKWEVGLMGKFTEVISPIYEGVPRARLQINVMHSEEMKSVEDLKESQPDTNWIPITLGELGGIQRDTKLSHGVHQVELQLFKALGEVIILTIDGKPGKTEFTAFDKVNNTVMTSLQSFGG